jgi:hypothetical protein
MFSAAASDMLASIQVSMNAAVQNIRIMPVP